MTSTLGPLKLTISGDHPARRLIEDELSTSGGSRIFRAQMDVGVASRIPEQSEAVQLSGSRLELRHSVSFQSETLRVSTGIKRGPTLYTVDIEGDFHRADSLRVMVYLPDGLAKWDRIASPITRLASRDSSTLLEIAAKNTIYEIIDTVGAYRLPMIDATMLHASALSRNGRAVVLAGTGGVGKSTTLLAAMEQDPTWSYVSDDMLILESNGRISRHPKRIQVYAYNVAALPALESSILSRMSTGRRRTWEVRARVLGPKQARVRIDAEDLFGSHRVEDITQLGVAAWVRPIAVGAPSIIRLEAAELARRSSIALVDEVWDFARLLNTGCLLTQGAISVSAFQTQVEEVMATAFEAIPCYELSVPYGADPRLLLDVMSSVVDW